MPHDVEFEGCDAANVFAEVSNTAQSEETQSLWDRLLQEMEMHRVDGVYGKVCDAVIGGRHSVLGSGCVYAHQDVVKRE